MRSNNHVAWSGWKGATSDYGLDKGKLHLGHHYNFAPKTKQAREQCGAWHQAVANDKLCMIFVQLHHRRLAPAQLILLKQVALTCRFQHAKCTTHAPFRTASWNTLQLKLMSSKDITSLHVHKIDRIGRDLRDILNVIKYMTDNRIPIHFETQGIVTLDENGKENSVAKLMISVLGTVAEMNRNQIRENQAEGIRIAKAKGKYLGRKKGSTETALQFLSKPKHQKALELLNRGYKGVEVAKIVGIHTNTVSKLKRIGLNTQ